MDDHTFDPKSTELRRFEVITGTGRRRRWTAEVKARIVAESLAAEMPVAEVARRHGLRPQQLFGWRREARERRLALPREEAGAFVPIVTQGAGGSVSREPEGGAPTGVEIELGGIIVRVRGRVAAAALAEVLTAVKSVT